MSDRYAMVDYFGVNTFPDDCLDALAGIVERVATACAAGLGDVRKTRWEVHEVGPSVNIFAYLVRP